MNRKQHFIWVSLFFTFFLLQVTLKAQEPVILDSKMKPGISNDMRIEELKVRWKKAALENCQGIPCVTTPPAPSFTCGTSKVTDIDGNQYNTVLIGTQCWFKENLKVTKYNDGTAIPLDATQTSPTDGTSLTWQNWDVGRYTIYDNQASNGTNATNYGFMYNWYAAAGIITSGGAPTKNICPSGWKVPTHGQWTILEQLLGGPNSAGIALKSTSILWSFLTNANNTSDFTALPGGRRLADGRFVNVGTDAYLWSFPDIGSNVSWMRNLYTSDPDFYSYNNYNKSVGASIRCLKD
jgi:uncharacterized protein (TIGR02145 family)